MGKTKTFKTGAVVGSYPKPMLALLFDQSGLEIVPSKPNPNMPMDIVFSDIEWCKPGQLGQWMNSLTASQKVGDEKNQPKVLAVNYFEERKNPLEIELRAARPDETMFINFVNDIDQLFQKKANPPFQTVMLDSVTGLQDLIFAFISSKNPAMLSDARQWAFSIGQKVKNTCAALTCLSANIVVIMHSEFEKIELTGTIVEQPSVYSGLRNEIGCYFSQFFYAMHANGQPMVSTKDYQFVKGLGMRWPVGLPDIAKPDYKTLYGGET